MERRIIGIVLGMMVAVSTIWAEEQKGSFTLEPIWEKEFEDGLRKVCSELKPSSLGTETEGLAEPSFSLKAVETGKGVIKFFNEKGEIISEMKTPEKTSMYLSENGRYVAIQSVDDLKRYYEKGETILELKEALGNTLYKIKKVPESFGISPNGRVVATRPSLPGHISDYNIGLWFYDPSGSLTKRIDNIKSRGACAFSKDGSLY
ncbi:MAG: hypothetical protein AB1630_11615, partial [bacterium]